jgi:hypothetical protein
MGCSCKKRPGFDRNSVDIKNNINIKRYKKKKNVINSTNIKYIVYITAFVQRMIKQITVGWLFHCSNTADTSHDQYKNIHLVTQALTNSKKD